MSYRGVFLDKVHPNIRKKLDYLQANARDISRSNRDEELQTPWIKLTSNADSCDPDFPVAKDYIMYSDIRDISDSAKSHKRLEGGGLYGTNDLNRPVPVIESITVSNKGALGSIRTATIKGTIFAEEDLEWFEKLYMQPGVTLLLEWGHSNTDINPIILTDDTRPADIAIQILEKTLQSKNFRNQEEDATLDGKIKDVGTYDGMLGVITRFNWANGSQGYDFTVDIISPNSVMNSFDMSTSSLGIKVTTKTIVNDSSNRGVDKDNKNDETSNSIPMDDIEGMLTHLSAMGMSVSNDEKTVGLKKNDDGGLEDLGPDPLTDEENDSDAETKKEESTEYNSDVEIIRKTSKSVVIEFATEGATVPYSFSGKRDGKYTIVKNMAGHMVGMTARVPNNESFGTGKDDEMKVTDIKMNTFISWRFLEDLISSRMPDSTKSSEKDKKIISLRSTTLQSDGKYYANEIFGHPDLCSVNRGVCMLVGESITPFKFTRGEFKDYFPTWTDKEKFHLLQSNLFMSNIEEYNKFAKRFVQETTPPLGSGMGNLDGLWLNVDFILSKYTQNKASLNKFIYALLGGVNAACGNPWDFHIQNNANDPQKMAIVDLRVAANAKEIREERNELNANNQLTYKFNTQLGILRSINMSSKLPKAVASAAYVASAAANAGDYDDAGFNLYQADPKYPIFDGLSIKNEDRKTKCNIADGENEKAKEVIDGPSPRFDMKMSCWKAIVFGKDIGSAQSKMADYIKKIVFHQSPDNPNFLPPIPIELSFSLDGLSGLYMGNAIVMDTIEDGGILPNRYKHNVAFQVTQVSHKVDASGWDTDVVCMMRMVQSKEKLVYRDYGKDNVYANTPTAVPVDKTGKQPVKNGEEAEKVVPTPGRNGPPSNKGTNALHPEVQIDWEDIKEELRALGWQPRIVTAFRSLEEQAEKVAKGRSKVAYGFHGTMDENGNPASQALDIIDARYSYGNHPKSIAAIGKKATEDLARKFWGDLGSIAEDYGYRWGGMFGANGSAYYDFDGSPSENKKMGWDPGHIEKYGKDGLPTLSEAAANASKFLGRTITKRGPNVV